MKILSITIKLRSALGGSIYGDTLFGQLCWSVRNQFGQERLTDLLKGYVEGDPFVVVSDALPVGYLPLPSLPMSRYEKVDDVDRKTVKKRRWLAVDHIDKPLSEWLMYAVVLPPREVKERVEPQPHNAINRESNTTGKGEFAPYTQPVLWKGAGEQLQLYLLHDAQRIKQEEVVEALRNVGLTGYGRDASIGLGKFELVDVNVTTLPAQPNSNASLTLANSAPQGLGFDAENCYYTPFTRFGRHGDRAVHTGHPFKTPLLLAERGAVFADSQQAPWVDAGYVGQGVGGGDKLSHVVVGTVHQGYAPVVRVALGV